MRQKQRPVAFRVGADMSGFFYKIGIYSATALVGGNCRNRSHVGAFYANLNNTASNTWWNNGSAILVYLRNDNPMHYIFLTTW